MTLETLKFFCSKDPTRPNISAPFGIGSYSYATDGRIVIRVPRINGVEENEKAPNAEKLIFLEFNGHTVFEWNEIPTDLPDPVQTRCNECIGRGVVVLKNRYHEYECQCKSCDGDGIDEHPTPVAIGSAHYGLTYLLLLRISTTGCKIGFIGKNKPARLQFDGGDGYLMPMRVQ